jgi:hypothetical protein
MYNQPFSQPPGMFGAQSAMAQMQSAPSLPAGNPGAREYFNYSMETLSNAAMPQAMMPQGIGSLVPQYQFGGGVGYSGDVGIDWGAVAAAMDAAQAQADAAAAADAAADAAAVDSITQPSVQSDVGIPATSAPAPGFDPGTSYETSNPATSGGSGSGFDPGTSYETSPSTGDAQMQQVASDLNDLMSQMQGEAARGTFSRDDADSLNGASRGAATQGGPPDVDFTNLALETLQGGPPDVDFTNLALESLQDQQQAYQDYYDSRAAALTDPEYAESRQDLYNFLVNAYKGNVATGGGTFYESGIVDGKDEITKAEDLNKGWVNSLIKTFTPFQKGPVYNPATGSMTVGTYVDRGGLVGGGLGALVGGPFGALVGGSLGSGRGGYVPVNSIMSGSDGFDNPDMDMVSIPSQSEIDDIIARMTPPDTGDDIDPDLGDPQQAAAAVAPAYVPPVYQTYAGLGLPSVSPIPPLRRVTVPISSFVV